MQRNDMAEIKRLLVDGEELPGLTAVGDVSLEKGQIEAPENKKVRRISNGVVTIPAIEATYKLARNSETAQFLQSWFENDEVHDVTAIRADGHGVEFQRDLWQDCELVRLNKPAYDAQNPTYIQLQVTFVPWDVVSVETG